MKFFSSKWLLLVGISLSLAALPFIWFRPGELDLGGDSSRLYFYDPANYLWNNALFYILPQGIGLVESYLFNLPFVAFLFGVKSIVQSSYLLITLFSVLKLVGSFLSVYGILKILTSETSKDKYSSKLSELSSILGGLFYILSPLTIDGFWVAPITSHNQVFLNPLMFYLILRYVLTRKSAYLLLALIISFLFSPNFAWGAAPAFFSFYPLAMIFLVFYVLFIRKKQMPWKGILIGFLLFLGLQAFHLAPAVVDLFVSGTNLNTRIFSKENIVQQLNYFYGVIGFAKASINMLSVTPMKEFAWASVITPAIVIIGFLLNKTKKKTILLTGIFFLITFFLLTANITHFAIKFYEKLFYIPGFSMFRNFIGQWRFVYVFFYALLLGQALFLIFTQCKKRYVRVLFFGVGIFIILSAWPFLIGDLVTRRVFSDEIESKIGIIIDPQYEALLSFLRSSKEDTKVLVLPFTDSHQQVLLGINGGVYLGPSIISNLTGKKDFAGYQIMPPFTNVFLRLAKDKDYASLKRLLGLLNIGYVFHNEDPKIYETTFFPGYPYTYIRQYLPRDQKEYTEFVRELTGKKIFGRGSYALYKVKDELYLPHFYIAKTLDTYEDTVDDWYGKTISFFVNQKDGEVRTAFLEKGECEKVFSKPECNQKIMIQENALPKIQFEKINPTKYRVKVIGAKDPYILVFLEAFHRKWKVFLSPTTSPSEGRLRTYFDEAIIESPSKNMFFDNKTFETVRVESLPEGRHILVNGYANAWYIMPEDTDRESDYELVIEMLNQRIFYAGLFFSLVMFLSCLLWGIKLVLPRQSFKTK